MATVEEGGDAARKRINEIKWRNQGGSMEEIPGFNLTYNDAPIPPPPEPVEYKPPPPQPRGGKVRFEHTAARAALRAAGKLPGRDVIDAAHRRKDGKALRASDGAVLKCPYVVRLKSY